MLQAPQIATAQGKSRLGWLHRDMPKRDLSLLHGGYSELEYLFVYALYWQPHDIEETAFERSDTYETYPLLDAIGTGLVQGAIGSHIVIDFLLGKLLEGYLCHHVEGVLFGQGGKSHAGDHGMCLAAQFGQHCFGLGFIGRLAQHLSA